MKLTKKIIAVFLSILTLFSICSASTTVFAAEYTEQKARTEYFDSALSGYLKNIIDTEDAVGISEKEQVDEVVEEANSSVARTASTFSLRATPAHSTETAKEAAEELDIDHTRLTLELEDGENVAYLFSEPVSFIDDAGNLVYKDTNIKAVTDTTIINRGYSYENGNNDYKAYFSEDSSKGLLLVEKDGEEIRLVPNGTQSIGTVKQIESDMELVDSFEYASVYGIDTVLRFLPQLNGCKEEIVLSSYQGVSDFSFTLYTEEGTIAAINSKGEVEIIDSATKDIITTFVAPFANDSSGGMDVTSEHYTDCTYELEMISEGEYTLTISVPKEYLESENTVYPVVIDPTTDNISMTYDTAVYSALNDEAQSSNPTACFGKTSSSEYGKGRAMFYFKIPSAIEHYAKISSAKLWLRETTARTADMYVRPYIIKDSWNNTVTWDTKPSYKSTISYPTKSDLVMPRRNINSTSTDMEDNPYWYAFDIIYAVKAWTTNYSTNRGLIFIAECEAADGDYLWRAFATKEYTTSSYRPYAVIKYTNDVTKPTIESVTPNTTSWTNEPIKLTVSATDNVYKAGGIKEYSFFYDQDTWQTSNSKSFSENRNVYVRVKDLAGNISERVKYVISNYDPDPPVIKNVDNPSEGKWTNKDVKITINATDALSGIKESKGYSFDAGSTWQTANYKTYTEEGTYTVRPRAKDKAGNIDPISAVYVKIDKTKPTVKSVPGNPTSWTNSDVTLKVMAEDKGGSGVASYSFDNGDSWQSSASKTFAKNQTVYIKVKDTAGNVSAVKEVKITKIDKTVPTASVSSAATSASTKVTVTASDALSGLHSTPYSFDGGSTWQEGNTKIVTSTTTLSIKVRDKSGNIKTLSHTPSATLPITITSSITDWTNKNVRLTVTGTGISQYKFDSGSYSTTNYKDYSGNTTASITVKDSNSKTKTVTYKITNIDKMNPVISNVSLSETEWTDKDVSITVTASDALSGLHSTAYSFDGGKTWQASNTLTVSENGTYNVVVRDKATNKTTWSDTINIDYIDKTDPVAPSVYEQDGTLYISAPSLGEKGGSPETLKYQLGDNDEDNYIAVEGNSIELDIVRTYDVPVYAYVEDGAGNKAETTYTLENTLGEYTASYTDIALGEGLFPVEFGRTYTSTNGWFFSFDANVVKIDDNTYVFTDFYGEKQYFVKNGEGKYLSIDDEELTVNADSYVLTYGDMTCTFGILDGKINRITTDYLDTTYTWADNGTLTITGGATVTFDTDGNPTNITITRTDSEGKEKTKVVKYEWSDDGNLTKFFDAAYSPDDAEPDSIHNYAYTNGLLTTNDTETITYSAEGRVKLISQSNGSFVKYTYNDNAENAKAPNNIGAVTVSDSKGVTDTWYYADGVFVSSSLDSYSNNAAYAPESISDVLTQDSVADIFYVVTEDTSDENNETSETTSENTADEEADETVAEEETTDDESETTEETTVSDEYEMSDEEESLHTENIEYNSYGNILLKEEIIYKSETDTEPDVYKEEYLYDIWNQCVETISTSNSEVSVEKTEYDILGRIIKSTKNDKVTTYEYDSKGNLISEITNNEITQYAYSNNGNILVKTLPNDKTISYSYDLFGNMTSKTYLGYKYAYNTLGSIIDVGIVTSENPNGVILLSYNYSEDISQNLINADYGNEQSIKYYYTEKGEVASIKINDEEQYNYVYFENVDESGETVTSIAISDSINDWTKIIEDDVTTIYDSNEVLLYSVEDNMLTDENDVRTNYHKEVISGHVYEINSYDNADVFISNGETLFSKYYQFDEDDNIIASTVDNVVSSYYGYNDELVHTYNNQFNNMDQMYIYTYDDSENIVTQILTEKTSSELGETIESSETINYTYDNNKQLISAETSSIKYEYTYDDRGNILTKKEYSISLDENNQKEYTLIENDTDTYVYDESWNDKLISYNGQNIMYDKVGNPINYLGHNLTWTFGRLLAGFDDISYYYNEEGIRTSKQNGEFITKYYLDETNIIEQDDGVNRLHFLYDSRNEIIGFIYNGNVYYYVKNIQKDITTILNSTGEVITQYEYDPWGKTISIIGDTLIGELNPFRYRSYYYDSDIAMYYLQTRYYDPETGRFINCDDFSYIESQEEGLSWNPFLYCENNPVNLEDPTGHSIKKLLKGLKKLLPIVKLISSLEKYIVIKYDNRELKDEEGKTIDNDRTNSTKGIISVYFNKNTDEWYQGFKHGEKFFNAITEIAFDKFRTTKAKSANSKIKRTKKPFNRCFLFDKYCVSREIRLHLQGYLWANDYENVKSVKFFGLYYKLNKTKIDEKYKDEYEKNKSKTIKKMYIESACKAADICEADALYQKYEEAVYFGYYLSIANCYACTAEDPYCYDVKNMKRSSTFTRKGWIDNELSCSCK